MITTMMMTTTMMMMMFESAPLLLLVQEMEPVICREEGRGAREIGPV
jgi:hypothetical protein